MALIKAQISNPFPLSAIQNKAALILGTEQHITMRLHHPTEPPYGDKHDNALQNMDVNHHHQSS